MMGKHTEGEMGTQGAETRIVVQFFYLLGAIDTADFSTRNTHAKCAEISDMSIHSAGFMQFFLRLNPRCERPLRFPRPALVFTFYIKKNVLTTLVSSTRCCRYLVLWYALMHYFCTCTVEFDMLS